MYNIIIHNHTSRDVVFVDGCTPLPIACTCRSPAAPISTIKNKNMYIYIYITMKYIFVNSTTFI